MFETRCQRYFEVDPCFKEVYRLNSTDEVLGYEETARFTAERYLGLFLEQEKCHMLSQLNFTSSSEEGDH